MTSPKTVLITGGTGALGGAVVRRFLGDGHAVASTWVVDRERDALLDSLEGGDDAVALVRADVTDPDSVAAALQQVEQQVGRPDVLVHLVGAWKGGAKVQEHDLATWHRMMDLNLTTAFVCTRALLPHMYENDWGRIVLVSSRTARAGRSGQSAYAIAKAGVGVLAETIAEEARGTGVTANVVAPSTIDTAANRQAMPDADHSAWVTPDSVARSIAFLASDAAGDLRGAWLPVYGAV